MIASQIRHDSLGRTWDDSECPGCVVEDLGDVLAERTQHAATEEAGPGVVAARCGVLELVAWQGRRQWASGRFYGRLRPWRGRDPAGRWFGGGFGQNLVEIVQGEVKLLDLRAKLFEGRAEGQAQQLSEPGLEGFDIEALRHECKHPPKATGGPSTTWRSCC